MSAAYLMLIALLPRRPPTIAVVAVAFFFCPLLQWWFLPNILLPARWLRWPSPQLLSLRDHRRWVRIAWSALTAYVAVATC